MKLSDSIDRTGRQRREVTISVDNVLIGWAERARGLESDSQLLDDLIEMLRTGGCVDLSIDSEGEYYRFQEWHIDYQTYETTKTTLLGTGNNARLAIQAAIKEWKKEK